MTSLARPRSARTTGYAQGGAIGTSGSSFYIKVYDFDFDVDAPGEFTTGDGDSAIQFESTGDTFVDVRLRGAMIRSQAIGLTNMGADSALSLTLALSGDRELNMSVRVLKVRGHVASDRAVVPLWMILRMTNTAASALEASY